MDLETISLLTDQKGSTAAVSAVKTIQFQNPDLEIGSPRYGQLSDKVIISYKVPQNQLRTIVSLFAKKNLQIMTKDEELLRIINSNKVGNTSALGGPNMTGDDAGGLKLRKEKASLGDLEDNAEKGNYGEIIKVLKDSVNYESDVINKAKRLLESAVNTAIEMAYDNASKYQSKVSESVETLVAIASDKELKVFGKVDLMKKAGLRAIEICSDKTKHIDELIPLCNSNSTPPIINLKATAVFADAVFSDEEKFAADLSIAVRNLNTKWLQITFDIAGHELAQNEKSGFNKLLDYINKNR